MSLITTISNLFSKPEPKHQLGVSIGQKTITVCYLSESLEADYQKIELGTDFNQNLSADFVTKAVTDKLTKLSSELQTPSNCQIILPVSHYQIVQVDKPNVPDAEIAAALKWQVKDLVTVAVEDMIIDYFDGPILAGGAKLNVVCASKAYLTELVTNLTQDNINLKKISTEEFAFVSLVEKQDAAVLLVCQQPNEEIILIIVKKGKIYFHRRLRGFSQIGKQSEEELTMGTIDSLSLEIQRSTDYFERQLKQAPIKAIQVIVPIDNENILAEKLAQNTHIPVQLLALPESHHNQRKYAAAIGATLLDNLEKSFE
ncbi:MAG: hypothetical protein MJK12_09855 [Colwellia sp.]|nr:hypothetical protein [Colwellia sp.]